MKTAFLKTAFLRISFLKVHSLLAVVGLLAGYVVIAQLLAGCGQIVTGASIPHDERLVINGAVIAGQPIRNIQITRTIAPLDTFNMDKVRITDADARITVDGREYRLRLQSAVDSIRTNFGQIIAGPSCYETVEGLIAQNGKTYTLTVNWNGKTATATTTVPQTPVVASVPQLTWKLNITERTFSGGPFGGNPQVYRDTSVTASVRVPMVSRTGEVYNLQYFRLLDIANPSRAPLATYPGYMQPPISDSLGTQFVTAGYSNRSDGKGNVLIYSYSPQSPQPTTTVIPTANLAMVLSIEARDARIVPYLQTQTRLYESQQFNPLSSDGRNPQWNVSGSGIGLFIGQSTTTTITLRP